MGNSRNSGIPEAQTFPSRFLGNGNFPRNSRPWFPVEHPWKNVVADVLSRYGVESVVETTASACYSLGDSNVGFVAYEWWDVVAKHLDFDACVTAAVEAPS